MGITAKIMDILLQLMEQSFNEHMKRIFDSMWQTELWILSDVPFRHQQWQEVRRHS